MAGVSSTRPNSTDNLVSVPILCTGTSTGFPVCGRPAPSDTIRLSECYKLSRCTPVDGQVESERDENNVSCRDRINILCIDGSRVWKLCEKVIKSVSIGRWFNLGMPHSDRGPLKEGHFTTSRVLMVRELFYSMIHFRTASFTSRAISSLACFFAFSVMPTSLSSAPGDVVRGSNSRRWPSFVGMDTRAEAELEGPNGAGTPFEGGGAVSADDESCVRELDRECAPKWGAACCVCELVRACVCENVPFV